MNKTDGQGAFLEGLHHSIERFQSLGEQRKQIDAEMSKLRQYMSATIELLSPDNKEAWETVVDFVIEEVDSSASKTLTYAIKRTLQVNFPDWLTAAKVRDQLIEGGFDFSSYKSNELASVSTTLRRLKDEIRVRTTNGVTEYTLAPPNFPTQAKFGTGLGDALRQVGPDPNKLPSDVAGAIYGGVATDSPQNQPASHLPRSKDK